MTKKDVERNIKEGKEADDRRKKVLSDFDKSLPEPSVAQIIPERSFAFPGEVEQKKRERNERLKELGKEALREIGQGVRQGRKIVGRNLDILTRVQPVSKKQISFIQRLNPAPALSREQEMMRELFSGEGIWSGNGECLPFVRENPTSFGLGVDRTSELFGIKRNQNNFNREETTGSFFGF